MTDAEEVFRPWDQLVRANLQALQERHAYRRRRTVRPISATHVELDGRTLINFCSNNYLGLSHHPHIIGAIARATAEFGYGSGAAPLITGHTPLHASAERAIARWKKTDSAVLLPSGYQANLAAMQTAAAIGKLGGGVRFLVDKLAHASLIDAIRASDQPFRVFPHNHIAKLRRLLTEADAGELQVVVTESIFSMDGDAAELTAIAKLKEEFSFLLIVDEAHASGVYGSDGAGLAAELGVCQKVDVSILTLSKALGGMGGAVCASDTFCAALVNDARAYLFSTAIAPAMAAATEAAIQVLAAEPEKRLRVRNLASEFRNCLRQAGIATGAGDSPIVPIILGDEKTTVDAADKLSAAGLLVMPVRPPTVPKGTSRLRITLSSEHTQQEIARLLDALKQIVPSTPITQMEAED